MTTTRQIIAETLQAETFAEFGQVIHSPPAGERHFFNEMLETTRSGAHFDLSMATIPPAGQLPLQATLMERHPFSSQTFLPLRASRYLVIVAPDAASGGPDLDGARAFVASHDQGITYRRGVWHHGMTVLDTAAEMAVLMWCDGSSGDEEFLELETPFEVALPAEGTGQG